MFLSDSVLGVINVEGTRIVLAILLIVLGLAVIMYFPKSKPEAKYEPYRDCHDNEDFWNQQVAKYDRQCITQLKQNYGIKHRRLDRRPNGRSI